MGRKIPGRKHRGVRDPEKQRTERWKKIKDKINAPPSDPDEQQIPKSLQRLAELQTKARNGDFTRKRPKKPPPKEMFEQYPNEPDRVFVQRVNRECALIRHEAAFEQKFGVEVKRNADGEVEEVRKLPKDPIQMMLKEARKQKKAKKNAKTKKESDNPKLTKSQKRRLKLAEKKKQKVMNNVDEFKQFQGRVKFGEQAHEPPTLVVPKKIKSDGVLKPGKKDLLLKTMLNKTNDKVIDRSGKRKNLPNALRRQLDKQQKEIVEAYRLMKGKKREVFQ